MENLYEYLFWHNPYEKIWYAIQRDSILSFFNGSREKAVYYKSKEISTLTEIISKDNILEILKES